MVGIVPKREPLCPNSARAFKLTSSTTLRKNASRLRARRQYYRRGL